jgi:hypothetical protein
MFWNDLRYARRCGAILLRQLRERIGKLLPGARLETLDLAVDRSRGVPASGDGDAAVVSWSWWNYRFRRDPSTLGTRIFVNDAPKIVVGVAPRGWTRWSRCAMSSTACG